jgi:hypothetical protein
MPKAYEAMRDKFAKGAAVDSPAYDAAQSKAAAMYNAKHKQNPVTGNDGAKALRKRMKRRKGKR